MLKFGKKYIQFMCTFVIFTMVFSCVSTFVVQADEVIFEKADYQTILNNSFIFHVGKNFYFKNAEKIYCNEESEYEVFPNEGNNVLVPVTVLQKLIDIKYEWSNKTETIKIEGNGNIVSMRLREDAILVNNSLIHLDTVAQRYGNGIYIPFIDTMKYLGYNTYSDNNGLNIASMTEELPLDIGENVYIKEAISDLFYDYLFSSSFEDSKPHSSNMLEGTLSAEGWSFSDWGKHTTPCVDAGITEDEHASGEKSIYIGAVNASFAGFESEKVPFSKDVPAYEVEYKLKASKDYMNNRPYLLFLCYNGKQFVASVIKGSSIVNSDGWTINKYVFSSDIYPEVEMDSFTVVVGSVITGDAGSERKGKVYFDDVKIRVCEPDSASLRINMDTDVQGNWYTLGDEAVFLSKDSSVISALKSIKGVVYNSYNEIIDEKIISSQEMIDHGWRWKASEPGFYEIEFYGLQHDGSERNICGYYAERGTNHSLEHLGLFERLRHSVVFAAKETKPMSERNDGMYISEKADSPLALYLADKIGFSGIRMHWIPWGPYGSDNRCISPQEGVYDWSFMDERINEIRKYGFNVIGNILFTPQWASSTPEPSDINGYGMYKYSIYAPKDMSLWEDFLKELVNRYKDTIKIWEIWNEPHIPGSSTFWNDTPEHYAEMLKSAYKTIKEIQPDSTVTFGGIGARRYTPFYKEILKTDVYDYFDVLAMHGSQLDPWTYNNLAKKAGYEEKPYMCTEGHYILLNSTGSPKIDYTESELSLNMLNEYFRDFKNGAKAITIFSMFGTSEIESLPFFKGISMSRDSSAIFRHKPYVEPRHLALVLHTLFDVMGKDFTYKSEYEFSDDQKAVLFDNNSEPMLVLWRTNGNKFKLDDSVIACMTDSTKIIDWEGREINSDFLTGSTVYFISGLDKDKLNMIQKADDKVIYNEYEKAKENPNVPTANVKSYALFDNKTFALSDNIEWIENNWQWVKAMEEKEDDFSAKMAVSVDKDGFYLVVDVSDNIYVDNGTDTVNNSYQYDSLQFAIDTVGDGIEGDRAEFQVGKTTAGASIFKETAPYIGGNLPEHWSGSNTVLSGKYVNIDNENGHIIYKVFIPTSELYPYVYIGGKDKIRLSVLVNNNNGKGRLGYLEWSSGIGASKQPGLYGLINIE